MPSRRVSHKVDYLGGSLLAVAATSLILLATWGGTQYAWGSAQIVGLALVTAAATVAFCVTEARAAEPMLPLHVFRNRNFSLTMVLTFLTGLAMFGAMTFLPLYQQTVQGESPTVSGLALTPMMLGVTVTSIVAGQVTTRTGRYKVFPILGGGIMAVASSGVHISTSGGQLDPATVDSLPAPVRHDVFFAIAHAVQHVFVWAVPSAVVIFVLAWFIKEVPLRGRTPASDTAGQQRELVS